MRAAVTLCRQIGIKIVPTKVRRPRCKLMSPSSPASIRRDIELQILAGKRVVAPDVMRARQAHSKRPPSDQQAYASGGVAGSGPVRRPMPGSSLVAVWPHRKRCGEPYFNQATYL